jgi:hypothetical protein
MYNDCMTSCTMSIFGQCLGPFCFYCNAPSAPFFLLLYFPLFFSQPNTKVLNKAFQFACTALAKTLHSDLLVAIKIPTHTHTHVYSHRKNKHCVQNCTVCFLGGKCGLTTAAVLTDLSVLVDH